MYAVPARPIPQLKMQADGSMLSVILHGDEIYHFYTTSDNYPLFQSINGSYYYASLKEDSLINSNILAHNINERSGVELKLIDDNKERCIDYILNINCQKRLSHRESGKFENPTRSNGDRNIYIGEKKGLVILVNFPDLQMYGKDPSAEFNRLFNEKGYNDNYHIGSVHDYFYDQSYGNFDLKFDIVGPVTVSREMSYYGKNDAISGNDKNPREMVAEACRLADPYVNFKDYDWDGDGEVEQVFVIYAGYGESNGAATNTIWPHESILYGIEENNFILDNVRIYTYACSCELSDNKGTILTGIGTPCHEFSHCLGLPDFYDVNYNGGFGMNAFDIMDNGSHNGPNSNGEVPCGYTAYERWYAGWLDFIDLNEMERIKDMPPLQDEPVAYRISNDNNLDEYFILENRPRSRWFSFTRNFPAYGGLIIYHVDYSPYFWKSNKVNTYVNHQRMSIVPADNDYGDCFENGSKKTYYPSASDFNGDFFPGEKNITEFTDLSHYSTGGTLFNSNSDGSFKINKPVTNIKETEGFISFDFMGGIFISVPFNVCISELSENEIKISWESDMKVDFFEIQAVEIKNGPGISSVLNPAESLLISNITQDNYILNNLKNTNYKFRIRASLNEAFSKWSEYVSIDLANSNSAEPIFDGSDSVVKIFDLSGKSVSRPLSPGIYILKSGNKTSKIRI